MKRIPEVITEEEFKQIIEKAKHPHHKLAYMLGFYQGMRISEIIGLGKEESACCRADINKTFVRDQWNKKQQVMNCSSCNNVLTNLDIRRSTIEQKIPRLTKDKIYNNIIHLTHCKNDKDRNIPLAPEVEEHLGELPIKICTRSLEVAFARIAKKVLGKKLHFHCLRHSAGTHYYQKWNNNIRMLQQFLGHSNLNTTEIYTHVNPQQMMEMMRGA